MTERERGSPNEHAVTARISAGGRLFNFLGRDGGAN